MHITPIACVILKPLGCSSTMCRWIWNIHFWSKTRWEKLCKHNTIKCKQFIHLNECATCYFMGLHITIHKEAMQYTAVGGNECNTTKHSPWLLYLGSTRVEMQFMAVFGHALTTLLSVSVSIKKITLFDFFSEHIWLFPTVIFIKF